jgi:peroxiredoxin
MKRSALLGAAAALALAGTAGLVANGQAARTAGVATQIAVPVKADNFRLTDTNAKSHELSYYKNASAIVVISYAPGSPHLKAAAPTLQKMQADLSGKGVRFFLLNSVQGTKRAEVAAEMAKLGLNIPVLMDDAQLVGESLGVSRAAQALVIEPKSWKIVYSGPIDNRFAGKTPAPKGKAKAGYLASALDAALKGQAVPVSTAKLDTPSIAFASRTATPRTISYVDEVAPILEKNCAACHSVGGIGPFAMNSYETVKGFAPMIRESIRTDRMPPYNADPHTLPLKDSMNLSVADARTLVHWIESGAPRGEGEDPLKAHARPAPEWELGPPDLIITLPAQKVPASGVVDYTNPVVDNPLTEGRWLRASQVKAGDRQAVHHLLSNGVGGYAVGAETTKYPEGMGSWVAPGTKFQFQMHYTPYGKETVDVTRVGLYFYPKGQEPTVMRRSAVIANAGIEIPPNTPRHEEIAYITFPQNATLYSVFPHSHYRGENMSVSIQKPGQKEEQILNMPKYDFNWQRGYEFAQPVKIPAGTRLITRYQFDNSKDNPANPDPTITVRWGEQSWEEMQYTALGFLWDDETVKNQKPEYMAELNATRAMGTMDKNLDGMVQKTEVRGRMAQMLSANFDRMDTDKDGALNSDELKPITQMMNRRIQQAQDQQSVGQ